MTVVPGPRKADEPADSLSRDRRAADTARTPLRRPAVDPGLRHRRQLLPVDSQAGAARRKRGRGRRDPIRRLPRAGPGDLPRRRHQPLRPGHQRLGAARPRRQLERPGNPRRRRADPPAAGCHRRPGERLAGAVRPQDRSRPGLDQRLQDRRHRRQQRQRHVLRHRAEQLPHPCRPAPAAGRRHPPGQRGPGQRRGLPRQPRRAAGTARRTRPRDPRQRRTGREDPPQVPAEEHHRPVAERAGRLRRAAGHPHPPDGRLRGHPRLHQRGDLRHRPGTPAQGLGAAGFPHGGNLLHGGRGAQAPAGLGGGTARSAQPALGGEHAGHAGMGEEPFRRCLRPAHRVPRGEPHAAARTARADHGLHRRISAGEAGRLQRRPGGLQPALAHPQGHLPGCRRGARDRHHGDHRGRHLPRRTTGRGSQPPDRAVRQAPLR
ncbi:LigA [Pseudomonas aeruginosa]|nr:LigA [Pseudomonas aeruginosa]